MASLRELRTRLRSIQSTQQLAEAMKTAATAKHFKISNIRRGFTDYESTCNLLLQQIANTGITRQCDESDIKDQDLFILLGGHRGLCGGFNNDMLRFFKESYQKEEIPPLVLAGGRKMQAGLHAANIPFQPVEISDVPTYEEAKILTAQIIDYYRTGEVENVVFIYPAYKNMLMQTPSEKELFLVNTKDQESSDILFLPDATTLQRDSAKYFLEITVYNIMLETALGAQGATVTAMRTACDNAKKASQNLSLAINRRRQADVTSSVLETSTGLLEEGDSL